MKYLLLFLLLPGCSMFKSEAPKKERVLSVVEKIEECVRKRINEGVKPLDALEICDTIYRGRKGQ